MSTKQFLGVFSGHQYENQYKNLEVEGDVLVRPMSYRPAVSNEGDEDFPFTNPTPQLLIAFVAPEQNATYVHRFNGASYLKADKIEAAKIKEKGYTVIEHNGTKWVCKKEKVNGKYERVVDEEGVQACSSIFNRFLASLGAKADKETGKGPNFQDVLDNAIENKILVKGTMSIAYQDEEGNSTYKIDRWSKFDNASIVAETTVSEEEDAL